MIALAYHFGLFQVQGREDLIDDRRSDDLEPYRLVQAGQVALVEHAHVALAQAHVLFAHHAFALERAADGDHIAKQADLGRHEHRPWRAAITAHPHRHPAQRLCRAFQRGSELLVAQRHAQARVKAVDLDLETAFGLAGRQIILNCEFKKPLSDTDKLFRQGESVSQSSNAGGQQAQRSKDAGQVAGQASEKCRFRVHTVKKARRVPIGTKRRLLVKESGMAGVMDSVNQRTQLVGQNRLELLLFRLNGDQLYGINVFKVREVLQCPNLTIMPKSNPVVRGVANIRGATIPILDLAMATGMPGLSEDVGKSFVIITEYNTKTQGFLVHSVERIVNMNWEEIHPPPKGTGRDHYLTAVTRVDNKMVEIIDVEKILAEVSPTSESISAGVVDADVQDKAVSLRVLTVDDSSVARKQVSRCLQTVGVEVVALNDGRQALDYLRKLVDEGKRPEEEFLMMISDIEMPEMDGYTLTAAIRSDPRMQKLHIILHTSLSGVFNQAMVKKVGADDFLAKFRPDDLAQRVVDRIKTTH